MHHIASAPYCIYGGRRKNGTINSSETGRAAATKTSPARNSFYNILINVPDNSALSSARELNGISRPLRCRTPPLSLSLSLSLRSSLLPCLVMPRTFNEYYPVCEPCEAIELISLPFPFILFLPGETMMRCITTFNLFEAR